MTTERAACTALLLTLALFGGACGDDDGATGDAGPAVDAGPADDLVRELHEILFPEEFSEDEVFGETWDELNELATKVERPSSTPTPSRRMERAEPEAARA